MRGSEFVVRVYLNLSNVAGVKKTVLVDGLGSVFGAVVVPFHDHGAPNAHFTTLPVRQGLVRLRVTNLHLGL